METIAVYWEETIRTYGFNLLDGQMLYQISLPLRDAAQWGGMLRKLDERSAQFKLVWAQAEPQGRIKIRLLCDDIHWNELNRWLDEHCPAGLKMDEWDQTKVDLIYFQGPHFGDRYGIMDFTLKALAKQRVPLLAAVCSVASIYLILPVGWGHKTKDLLSGSFEIPREKRDLGGLPA